MSISRRSFLVGGSLAAIARPRLTSARGLLTDPTLDDIIKRALDTATAAGATYADVRIVRHRRENVAAREDKIERVSSSEDYGVGVRVIAVGAWGFAATPVVTAAEAERVAKLAVEIAKANAPLLQQSVK